jgi:hypothetical protein
MKKIFKSRGFLVNVTVLLLAILLGSLIWMGFSATYPSFILFAYAASLLSVSCLFFVNLGFAVFKSKQRITHIIVSLLIVITLFWFFPFSIKWHRNTERRWFFQGGMQNYEVMIDKVVQNKAMLTSKSSPLGDIVGNSNFFGQTNVDGSIIIVIAGRGGYSRAGYLYYSGSQMSVNPENTNQYCLPDNPYRFYTHLANGWYEF